MSDRFDLLNIDGTSKVLVVEDDPVSSMLVQRLFSSQGIKVDVAQNGLIALEKQKKHGYRLVVSDWMMPEMDGVELCRQFRQLHSPYVYFILCSAKGQKEDRREAFEAGVDDFLSKPLDRDELHGRLKVASRILLMEEDLQEQKQELSEVNVSLALASQRFEGLFNGLPVACFTFDNQGNVMDWNLQATQVFGFELKQAFRQPVWELLNPTGGGPWNSDRVSAFFTGGATRNFDWSFLMPDGTVRYLTSSVICLPSVGERPPAAVCANLDITERKLAERRVEEQMHQINAYAQQLAAQAQALSQMNSKLNHLAVTDGLTGLWNQRRFFELLEETVSQHNRTGEEFSVILIDIDHFKQVNDEFGHQAGDEMLREFADELKCSARSHELPARYGGEEFAIILRSCGEEEAIAAAERFRLAIETRGWNYRNITGSFGVATSIPNVTTARSIVHEADAALYVSKATGRNRSTHFSSLEDNQEKCA
jgi:two-component system cell cycle response regulator